MATYFLDTSALVKRYFPEQGHAWIVTLCGVAQDLHREKPCYIPLCSQY